MFQLSPKDGEWTLTVWEMLQWTNPLLAWDPAEFSGIGQAALPSEDVWHPHDFGLFNQRRAADSIMDSQVE